MTYRIVDNSTAVNESQRYEVHYLAQGTEFERIAAFATVEEAQSYIDTSPYGLSRSLRTRVTQG